VRLLPLALGLALFGCKKAPAASASSAPAAGGPVATIFNGAGAEVREVCVSCPGIGFSSSTPSLKAGAMEKVALPKDCARVSVMFTRAPDLKTEKTVGLLGDSVTFTLAADGTIGAAMQP
jgi:hypothetical protein